ncbi:hypothetical protein [Formosa sp. A9]|uniref:hypothetical protein n=1 Tax=Formosa sp. A9 TaxID=3442641 RepID=UPI003EBD5A38
MTKKATLSYSTFLQNSGMTEFLIMFLTFAEHPEKENLKLNLEKALRKAAQASKSEINILAEFLEKSDSEALFDVGLYEDIFGQMAYSRLVDSCLCYFKEVLSEIVRINPKILKSRDTEPLDYILSFDNMDDLIEDLVEKKISQLFYGGVNDIEKYFKSRLNIELFETIEDKKEFNQLIKQRNLIVHNRGIITKEFTKEFPIYSGHEGSMITFGFSKISMINNYLIEFLYNLDKRLSEKFKLKLISLTD